MIPLHIDGAPPANTATAMVVEREGVGPTHSLSVVICAYTTRRWIVMCNAVDSVLAQDWSVSEVILVIDYCDDLFDRAQERFVSEGRVRVIRNAEKQGLSGARNTGVRVASGGVIAFVDDDASADRGWARILMDHYRNPCVWGVGGSAVPIWPAERPTWMPEEFDWVVGCSYVGQPTRVAPVRNLIGCNMSLRRSAFDLVGGFRSEVGRVGSTPTGCEETELCIRVRAHSGRILFDPEVRVRHRVTRDRTTLRYFVRRCYHEGVSKALVAELAGASDGLSSERAYTFRILPRAVLRGLGSKRKAGLARAGVVVLGLAVTTSGYLHGVVRIRMQGGMS